MVYNIFKKILVLRIKVGYKLHSNLYIFNHSLKITNQAPRAQLRILSKYVPSLGEKNYKWSEPNCLVLEKKSYKRPEPSKCPDKTGQQFKRKKKKDFWDQFLKESCDLCENCTCLTLFVVFIFVQDPSLIKYPVETSTHPKIFVFK